MTNMSIQPLWLTYFIEILLVLEFQLTETYFGTFSYKAHFRPQISSNANSKAPKIVRWYPDSGSLFLSSPNNFFFLSYALQLSVSERVINREAHFLFILIPDLKMTH